MINLFSRSTGLNTVDDPVTIDFDPESGVSDLAEAVNVTISQVGRVGRRTGFTKVQDGSFHSLFCDGGDCFVCAGGNLYQVGTDNSLTGIRSGLSSSRVSFCQVNNDTYYSNGLQNGIITNGISSPWPDHSGLEDSHLRSFFPAPIANHIAFFASSIFLTEDNVLWWSEPFSFGMFDKARCFAQFPSRILMVKPVSAGLFVSDTKNTYFLRGKVPAEFTQEKVATYPAYEWSDAIEYVEGADIGIEPGLCAMWASPEGAVIGTASGMLINTNKDKVIYPETGIGGTGLLQGYNFIHSIY